MLLFLETGSILELEEKNSCICAEHEGTFNFFLLNTQKNCASLY